MWLGLKTQWQEVKLIALSPTQFTFWEWGNLRLHTHVRRFDQAQRFLKFSQKPTFTWHGWLTSTSCWNAALNQNRAFLIGFDYFLLYLIYFSDSSLKSCWTVVSICQDLWPFTYSVYNYLALFVSCLIRSLGNMNIYIFTTLYIHSSICWGAWSQGQLTSDSVHPLKVTSRI